MSGKIGDPERGQHECRSSPQSDAVEGL